MVHSEAEDITSGAYVVSLLQRQVHRIDRLQPRVLTDEDPESLHQLRVAFRRLRTLLHQFAPALTLPPAVKASSIARVARRTGRTRDLDVLLERLQQRLLPALPQREQERMVPFLRQLLRQRQRALAQLQEALQGRRYRRLMRKLPRWLAAPAFTPLGERPLRLWLHEWLVPISSGLFLHPGWFCRDSRSEELHDLRKRIKGVRYAMEHLEPFLDAELGHWVGELKQAQDNLGDLHDLQVLGQALAALHPSLGPERLPALQAEIARQQQHRWTCWQDQADRLCRDDRRLSLHLHLARLGEARDGGLPPQEDSAAEAGASPSMPH